MRLRLRTVAAAAIVLLFVFVLPSSHLVSTTLSKDAFLASTGLNHHTLSLIQQGAIFDGVGDNEPWRRRRVSDDLLSALPSTSRTRIYTYVDDVAALSSQTTELLKTWRRAWHAAGFSPKVLQKTDAEANRRYPVFMQSATIPDHVKQSHLKYVAWLAQGHASIYSHYTIVPVHADDTYQTLQNLRQRSSRLDAPTAYSLTGLEFVQAGSNRINQLMNALLRIADDEPSTFADQFFTHDEDVLAYYSNSNLSHMMADQVDWSPAEINEAINVHLHQQFLARFQAVAVANPFPQAAQVLLSPASRLAERIATCPMSIFTSSCPPTAKYLAGAKCQSPCTNEHQLESSGRPVIKVDSLPPVPTEVFTVVSVPHPVSLLALLTRDSDVLALSARQHLDRDRWLRQVLAQYLPKGAVGSQFRLMLAKDAVAQPSWISNSTWLTWEDHVDRSEAQDQLIELDLGFSLAKALNTGDSSDIIRAEEPDLDDEHDGDDTSILHAVKKRVLAVKPDADFGAIQSWNGGDAELWQFLRSWTAMRAASALLQQI